MKQLLLVLTFLTLATSMHAQTDITFCVDMTSVSGEVGFAAQAIAFDFNNFNSGSTPLSDPEGDNIFCGTFSLAAGEVRYNFFYAAAFGDAGPENLTPLDGQFCVSNIDGEVKRRYTVVAGVPETVFFVWETCDNSLPVELISFTGETLDKKNRLYWQTAREENVQWHILERSNNGRNNWQELARTQGARSGTQARSYTVDDDAPLPTAYYRLRSVDYDGSEGFSPVIQLVQNNDDLTIRAYPNPVTNRLEVMVPGVTRETLLRLFTSDGREVLFAPVAPAEEGNTLSFDLSGLAPGVYFLRVNEQTLRVVKD